MVTDTVLWLILFKKLAYVSKGSGCRQFPILTGDGWMVFATTTSEVVSMNLNLSTRWRDICLNNDNKGSVKFGQLHFCFC